MGNLLKAFCGVFLLVCAGVPVRAAGLNLFTSADIPKAAERAFQPRLAAAPVKAFPDLSNPNAPLWSPSASGNLPGASRQEFLLRDIGTAAVCGFGAANSKDGLGWLFDAIGVKALIDLFRDAKDPSLRNGNIEFIWSGK